MCKKVSAIVLAVLVCMSLMLCMLPAGAVQASGPMYVINPGFESPGYGGQIQAWEQTFGTGGISWASDRKYSGSYSAKITDTSSTSAFGIESEKIFITPYQSYTAKAKVNVDSGAASIYIRYYDSAGTLLTSNYTGLTTPLDTWTDISVTETAPSNASYLRILLYTGISSISTAYFDDVTLARNDLVANKGFESQLANWTQTIGSGSITAATERAYSGSYSCKIADTSAALGYGITCAKINVTPGEVYKASAMCYISSGSAAIYIYFYDSADNVVGTPNKYLESPVGQWSKIEVVDRAPSNAVKAAVLLYSSKAGTGTAYYDDVDFASAFTFIGNQIYKSATKASAIGTDSSGTPFLYTVTDDISSANFIVINLNTNQVVRSIELPGALGAWDLTVASDKNVYVGVYPNHKVYKYVPGSSTITEIDSSALSGDTYTFAMTASKTTTAVYGGTYMSARAYKVQNNVLTVLDDMSSEYYVRSITVDDAANMLYCGIGSHAQLIRYNLSNGTKTNILPPQYADEEFVYCLNYAANKIFMRLTPSNKLVVMDKTTLAVDAELDCNSIGSSGLSPVDDKVYYSYNGIMYSYDISSKTATEVADMGNCLMVGAGFVQLADQTNWPGYTMCGLGNNSLKLYKYNLQTGRFEIAQVEATPVGVQIHNVKAGPAGKIYSSGYLVGGVGIFNPADGSMVSNLIGVSQSEGMAVLENKMYFGVYPGARLQMNDCSGSWSPVTLAQIPTAYLQDRPVATIAVGSEGSQGKVYMGTIAGYGNIEGALSIYDIATGSLTVKKGIVPDEGIASLAYKDGKVYGGSTIYGGIGGVPTQPYARIFIYDTAADTSTVVTPFASSGHTSITSLIVGPDGNIWGWDQGRFFIMDPENYSIIYSYLHFPGLAATWKDATMEIGNDGYVYGTINNKLYRIDPSTRELTVLRDKGDAFSLTKDSKGDLYFNSLKMPWLWRFEP